MKCRTQFHLDLFINSKTWRKTFPRNLVLCCNDKHSAFVSQPRERGQVAGGWVRDTLGLVGGNILYFTSRRSKWEWKVKAGLECIWYYSGVHSLNRMPPFTDKLMTSTQLLWRDYEGPHRAGTEQPTEQSSQLTDHNWHINHILATFIQTENYANTM